MRKILLGILIVITVSLFFFFTIFKNSLILPQSSDSKVVKHHQTIAQEKVEKSTSQASPSIHNISQGLSSKHEVNLDEPVCKDLIDSLKEEKDLDKLKDKINSAYQDGLLALEKLLNQAKQSSHPQHRAAALLLESQLLAQKMRKTNELNAQCNASEKCLESAETLALNVAFPNVNEVAKLAIYSNDAKLYAMAFQACNKQNWKSQGYCLQITADQWAKREPNNGMTWLFFLTDVEQTKKVNLNGELDAAMFRLAEANYFDMGFTWIYEFINNETMQSKNVFVRPELSQLGNEIFTNMNMPSYRFVLDFCHANQLMDSNRWQVCKKITEKMVKDEQSLLNFSIGKKIAERLSWSKESLQALQDEKDAIYGWVKIHTQKRVSKNIDNVWNGSSISCLWNKRDIVEMEEMMREGDLGYFRHQMARQTLTQAQLAEVYRQDQKKLGK